VVKSILKKIVSTENEDKRLEMEESLDELITNVQFANDECDFGMGLELGIDLFCYGDPYFHPHILSVLPLAYKLLNRPKYAEVIKFHLANRKKSDDLITLV
ncbi:putative histone PARylation factor 1-like, partial [Nephila pilipes]